MASSIKDVRILLIQARKEKHILRQEVDCFSERCRIPADQIVPYNVIDDEIRTIQLTDYEALMIGGSGAFSAASDYPWMDALLDLVRAATDQSFPTFGSCWGHQIIARALGGRVAYDRERTEMGSTWITLTGAGRQDELFHYLPDRFRANSGHHDRVTILPEDAIDLAVSDTQPHQAFRIKNKPIYGTQFHSELNAEREKERLIEYRPYYTEVETDREFQAIIDGLQPTTEVDGLLHAFLDRFVLTYA